MAIDIDKGVWARFFSPGVFLPRKVKWCRRIEYSPQGNISPGELNKLNSHKLRNIITRLDVFLKAVVNKYWRCYEHFISRLSYTEAVTDARFLGRETGGAQDVVVSSFVDN